MIFFDLVQSYIIKAIVILIILKAMLLLQDLLYEHTEKAKLEGELSTASYTFSSDMRQTGYNTALPPIAIADTSQVKIRADIDNNGSVDSVTYTLSNMPSSSKFYLQRTVNTGTTLTAGRNIKKFYLTYYDSVGNVIPTPVSSANLTKIKSIFTEAKMENDVQFHDAYLTSSWRARIYPPNLNR